MRSVEDVKGGRPRDNEPSSRRGVDDGTRDYVVVFGAAVRPGGGPSGALRHRIEGALAWAFRDERSMLMPTGGVGRYGPAEAVAMEKAFVDAGIDPGRIVAERFGRDTLESVRLCHRILVERGDCRRVVCCTSTYHQPRCALLFRLLGYEVVVPRVPNSMGAMRRRTYGRLLAREVVAIPYDSMLLLARPR